MTAEASLFIDRVPELTIVDGNIHISMKSGSRLIERVMSRATFTMLVNRAIALLTTSPGGERVTRLRPRAPRR